MKTSGSTHLAGLDLIRLTAAMFVVFDHFTASARNQWVIDAIGGGMPSYPAFSPITDAGWVGVDIFFVISGLVIAYSANGNSPRRFAESRFFRLMPSVWIASTISVIVLLVASTYGWRWLLPTYLRSLILTPIGPWVDGSYWTLAVEIVFYTLIFVILCKDKFGEIDKILGFGGIAVSVLAVATPALVLHFPRFGAVLESWPAKLLLLHNGSEFVFGVFLYLVLFIGMTSFRLSVLVICFLGACAQISFPGFRINAPGGGIVFVGGMETWFPLIVWIAAVLAMILSVRWNAVITTRFRSAMPAVRQLGLLTYPLYLIHSPLGLLVMQRVYWGTHSPALALIAAVLVVMLTAAAILLTEPALRAKVKLPVRRGLDVLQGWFAGLRLAEPTSRLE
ncbi:MAG TPA: acyltransferase [Methylocella sp.]|nr:acyltransferase [Methylocella sp.]